MRILLTNDDGISSPGISLLAKTLREAGHRVFTVAPDTNRSGCSHSISLSEPIKLTELEKDTWVSSGTPSDCVLVSLLGGIPELCIAAEGAGYNMEKAPDLVLAGINAGANLGTDIVYSGTAAAARQGSFFGIPSVALSLVGNDGLWNWEPVISYITENLAVIMGYWKTGTFINVNFPNIEKKPFALVPVFPSIRYYNEKVTSYTDDEGGVYCLKKLGKIESTPADGCDWAEVQKNNAALSVILSQPVAAS